MKTLVKHFAAIVPLCGAAGAACAQASAVELYGTVDLALAATDNGAGAHATTLSSGVSRPSMFGLAGAEDLGGGVKAVFRLEAGFDADTGAMKAYQGNPSAATPAAPGGPTLTGLFNRRAYVGIGGPLGTVTLGRDYTPIYWGAMDSDALSLTMYGNLQESVAMSGTGSDRYGRASNAVFYLSPSLGGLVARLMYSAGSESGGGAGSAPSAANRMLGASGKFTAGAWMVTAVLQQLALPKVAGTPAAFTGATGTRKDMLIGTRYAFDAWALTTGYFTVRQPTAADTDGRVVWLGGTWQLPRGVLHASVQRLRQNAAAGAPQTAVVSGLAYLYPLSKRTSLYCSYGRVGNGAGAAFPLVSADPSVGAGAPGASVRALALGVRHSF